MRWWPMAATVAAAAFVVALGALLAAPSLVAACNAIGEPDPSCDSIAMGARSLVVGSGAILAASLVAGLYTVLLARANRQEPDTRPLVSVHARRRN